VKGRFEFYAQSAWPPAFSSPGSTLLNPASSEDGNNENQHEEMGRLHSTVCYQMNHNIFGYTSRSRAVLCKGQKLYVPNDYLEIF